MSMIIKDSQVLIIRTSHVTKFIRLKTHKHNHYNDQILRTRISHMTKFTRLTSTIVIKQE